MKYLVIAILMALAGPAQADWSDMSDYEKAEAINQLARTYQDLHESTRPKPMQQRLPQSNHHIYTTDDDALLQMLKNQ